jgi:hypothetical protein
MPTSPSPALSGHWQGTVESSTDGLGTVSLQLVQTGVNVSGSVVLTQNGISNVTGTLTGILDMVPSSATLQYTVTYEYADHCQGAFTGTVTVSGREMAGPYSGQNCVREFMGSLRAMKSD